MTDAQILGLVYKMRTAQKAYFKNRLNKDLQESKALEREVDHELSKKFGAATQAPQEQTGKLW